MPDLYDVLSIPVELGGIIDKETCVVKPFVGIYFPTELLKKMSWTKETRLTISVEKDHLKIVKADAGREEYFIDTRELVYEAVDESI